MRASLDGVIETFYVQPNELVKKDQPLFSFDSTLIKSQLGITRQALATAQAEYRQAEQQALTDSKVKVQLPIIRGRIDEKTAELAYMTDQLTRAEVLAPQDGVALFDDPSEWIGKPVTIGERVMRIASLDDVEIQAWIGVADAIDVRQGAPVALFLRANPTSPVDGKLRYFAHEAIERPDMTYAYRLRAVLDKPTLHRVGLKGTAKLYGRWVPFVYWAMRRPIASLRTTVGW
jgi:multidrug resistance efflux pump